MVADIMSLVFTPISPGQARALGRLGRMTDPPGKFIIAIERDNESNMVVVPASSKDQRRWDITKGGAITKGTR